jgi:hypothetical protein
MNDDHANPLVAVDFTIEVEDDSGNVQQLLKHFPSVHDLHAGDLVRIEGSSGTFEGVYRVISVRHSFHTKNGYRQCIVAKVQPL